MRFLKNGGDARVMFLRWLLISSDGRRSGNHCAPRIAVGDPSRKLANAHSSPGIILNSFNPSCARDR